VSVQRRGRSALLTLLLTAGPALAQEAVGVDQAADWLRSYHREYPIGGGWEVARLAVEEGDVVLYLALPRNQAQGVMAKPIAQQRRILAAIGCPNAREKFWRLLPYGAALIVRPMTGGKVFLDLSCREGP